MDLSGASQYVSIPSGVVSGYSNDDNNSLGESEFREQLDADIRFWYRNDQLHVSVAAKRSNNKIRFTMKVNGSTEQVIDGTAALPTGGWHHMAITLSGSTGTLYVDGLQVGSNTSMFKPSDLGVTTQN